MSYDAGLRGELLSRLMTKVAAELAGCGQPDALRRSFVLAIAPALCLDASRATQVHIGTCLCQPHARCTCLSLRITGAPSRGSCLAKVWQLISLGLHGPLFA